MRAWCSHFNARNKLSAPGDPNDKTITSGNHDMWPINDAFSTTTRSIYRSLAAYWGTADCATYANTEWVCKRVYRQCAHWKPYVILYIALCNRKKPNNLM